MIIGLTGQISTGKTFLLNIFSQLGIAIFNSDKYVRILYQSDLVKQKIMEGFPNVMVNNNIDPVLLKQELFTNYDKNIIILENILHPLVEQKVRDIAFEKEFKDLIVIEVPLLFQSNIYKLCDYKILTFCTYETQKNRILKHKKLEKELIDIVLNKQEDIITNVAKCDFILSSEISPIHLKTHIRFIIERLTDERI